MKYIDVAETSLNMKRLLENKSLSASKVQNQLGLASQQAVYKWLNPNNKGLPSLDNLVGLAGILNCSLDLIIITKDDAKDKKS